MEQDTQNLPKHIAIIMDGNRRWARENGMKATEGHKYGAKTLEKIVSYSNQIGVKFLTVFAFSTENWKRGKEEVGILMNLLRIYLEKLAKKANEENIKINIIGDIDAFENDIRRSLVKTINSTANNSGLVLNIALNYGGRAEIVSSIKKIANQIKEGLIIPEEITEELVSKNMYNASQPDPDLLIRTSGEQRISNFLLWNLAYTEMYFTNKYWPEFTNEDLMEAIQEYKNRNRRFGGK